MVSQPGVQYLSDADDSRTDSIVQINPRLQIESEREKTYLLRSENMKRRLVGAAKRRSEISFGTVRLRLGL